ncbi:MAG: hypothetical protein KF895_11160 [Parvibaculum sp.]|nr:hypothetical protein [Parvibaculum sp.]
MRFRQRVVAGFLILAVLALAAFSMWIILLRMRPLDPEMLRAPGFSQTEVNERV